MSKPRRQQVTPHYVREVSKRQNGVTVVREPEGGWGGKTRWERERVRRRKGK